jgi:hypothetical protein
VVAAGAVVTAVAVAPSAGATGAQPLTSQLISQLSTGAQQPVIVLLRDQHPDVPATQSDGRRRTAATQADQAALVDQVRQTGATKITQFSVINGFAASMTVAERDHLTSEPQVAAVVPDLPIRTAALPAPPDGKARPTAAGAPPAKPLAPNVCPTDPVKPLLEPEALQATNAAFADPSVPQAQSLATGQGVKVGYLADGVDINNPDFVRPDGSKVFSDYKDFTGEGTATPGDDREAFGDASSIAAQGKQTYDLSTFVNLAGPLPTGCDVQVRGMAPGASLVGLKVIASNGFGSTSAVVQAIDYAVNVDHVDVLNESLGSNPYPDNNTDPFSLANEAAVAAGVTVVASAGDAGYGNTVDSPASDPSVISAGASTTYQLMAQTHQNLPGFNGTWLDNNVSAISSSGVSGNGHVDDLVAPGDLNWALCTADAKLYTGCTNYRGQPAPIQAFGGTSEASPLIAGAAALVIQAYESTHNGVRPTPGQVKEILTSTATDEYDPAERQGAGLLNALAAVQAAKSVPDANGSPAAVGNNLLFGTNELTASGTPNSPQSFTLPVTNVGTAPQTLTAHGRSLSTLLADQRGSVALDTTAVTPEFVGSSGATDDYVTRTFTVPAGTDHLDASAAWSSPNGNAVTMVLLDPKGAFAGYTMPQAATGPDFGHVDVHSPAAGTWTALVYSPHTDAGFDGPVNYEFTSRAYTGFGTVAGPPLTLAPGQTGTLRVAANTPAAAGDLAAALEVDTGTHQRFAVPMVLRSLIGTDGAFSGVLTGGNGRGGGPAQQNTYRFTVPPGQHDVGVSVTLHGDVNQTVVGYLVSPDGQILSQASNVQALDDIGNPTEYAESVQGYARDPLPGQWSYVVTLANPVSGSTTRDPFSGKVSFDTVNITADNLPTGAATVLPQGKPVTVAVHVHNTGAAAGSYFVDARSPAMADLQLTPGSSAANVPLGTSASTPYVVPTETTGLIGVTSASIPVSADLYANTGEPEVLGAPGPGNTAVAFVNSAAISPGRWGLEADPVGPFDAAVSGVANLTLMAHTQGFDSAVTSSTGDQWLGSVAAQPPAVHPLAVDPGATGTITVTITPNAAKGSQVSGVLYVDGTTLSNSAGDELIALPYSYKVG